MPRHSKSPEKRRVSLRIPFIKLIKGKERQKALI